MRNESRNETKESRIQKALADVVTVLAILDSNGTLSVAVAHFGVSYKMVHSLSEIWSAAATPPLWLSSQLTVGKEHPLVRPAQPKAKAPPLAAHSKWHRPISKMTHYLEFALVDSQSSLW